MNEKDLQIIKAMTKYGGSFVQALADCFLRADTHNFKKLKDAFPEYWEQYKIMAESWIYKL